MSIALMGRFHAHRYKLMAKAVAARDRRRNLAIGLGFKLVLAPLILFLLYVPLLGAHGQAIQITAFLSCDAADDYCCDTRH
ncbi:MAG: hypothetical protein R8M11_00355 [Gallionella sp.]